jgi:hypothetical protein
MKAMRAMRHRNHQTYQREGFGSDGELYAG